MFVVEKLAGFEFPISEFADVERYPPDQPLVPCGDDKEFTFVEDIA
jgi:hypothetical protein